MTAANDGERRIVELLLGARADVNAADGVRLDLVW